MPSIQGKVAEPVTKVNELPDNEKIELYRRAIKLHKEQKLGSRRISKILNISPGTIDKWIYHGKLPRPLYWESPAGEARKKEQKEQWTGSNNPMYGKHYTQERIKQIIENNKKWERTEEYRQNCREAQIKRWENNPEYRKSQTEHLRRIRTTHREKRVYYIHAHEKEVEKQTSLMNSQGFRAINVSISAKKPDIIAFKDGKIYAVEVETLRRRSPNYEKWEPSSPFDDIIWVIKETI